MRPNWPGIDRNAPHMRLLHRDWAAGRRTISSSFVLPARWVGTCRFRDVKATFRVGRRAGAIGIGGEPRDSSNATPPDMRIPTLATRAQQRWQGRSAAEVCSSEARKIGETAPGRRRGWPLAVLILLFTRSGPAFWAGTGPQRRVAGDQRAAAREESPPPKTGQHKIRTICEAVKVYSDRYPLTDIAKVNMHEYGTGS